MVHEVRGVLIFFTGYSNCLVSSLGVYHGEKEKKFLSHSFDLYAGLSFPDADVTHLDTCIAFFLWAFSVSHFLPLLRLVTEGALV